MLKKVLKKVRWLLGNFTGAILFYTLGRFILLRKIDESKMLSIYFHNPSPKVFENVVKWLIKHKFEIITVSKFQEYYKKKRCDTKRTAFITFDDAWSENMDLLPILNKYNVPLTLFVAVEPILEGQIWLNTVRKNLSKVKDYKEEVNLAELKSLSFEESRELYKACKEAGEMQRNIMTKEQLAEFSKKVTIGSHTVTHPILTNCSDEVIHEELVQSEKTLKDWSLPVHQVFAYPNGSYDDRVLSVIKKTNYQYAFTTEPKIFDFHTMKDNFQIPRTCIPDGFGTYENLARMSSVWSYFLKR